MIIPTKTRLKNAVADIVKKYNRNYDVMQGLDCNSEIYKEYEELNSWYYSSLLELESYNLIEISKVNSKINVKILI